MTYTFAALEVSQATFDEIAGKLRATGYDHVFVDDLIDMHGIALARGPEPQHNKGENMKRKMRDDLPLGRRARDTVSGFEGIIEARTEWLNGCFRISLAPTRLDKDGKIFDSHTFDAEQIEVLDEQIVEEKPEERRTNGPTPDAVRQGES